MEALVALAHQVGGQWLGITVIVIVIIDRTRIIQRWFSDLSGERDRNADERQRLIVNYENEAANQRRWRQEDATQFHNEILRLRKIIEEKDSEIGDYRRRLEDALEAIVLEQRGNSRMRHTVAALCQYIWSYRERDFREGRPLLPFHKWRDVMGIDPELDKKLQDMFGTTDGVG